jgi:hypothetical protein
MSRVRCITCKGEYTTLSADGTPYMHVCPPVRGVMVRHADGTRAIVAPDAVLADDQEIGEVLLARRRGRDETPDLANRDANGVPRIKAEGRGVTAIADDVVPVVGIPDAV